MVIVNLRLRSYAGRRGGSFNRDVQHSPQIIIVGVIGNRKVETVRYFFGAILCGGYIPFFLL